MSLFLFIFFISLSIGYHRSDYATALLFLFVCLSIIPVVNLQVFYDKIEIERLFFFGFFKRKYEFVSKRPIILREFDVDYSNPATSSDVLTGWYTAVYKKYSLKQTLENGVVNHVEIKLSKEELKIMIEQFLKDIVTYLPVEY
jgi:hypothetical protein